MIVLVIGGRWLRNLVGGFQRDAKDDDDDEPLFEETPVAVASPSYESEEDEAAAQTVEILESFGRRASLLLARARRILAQGEGDEAFEPIRLALEGPMLPGLDEVKALVDKTQRDVARAPTAVAIDPESIQAVHAALSLAQDRIIQLESWWQQREDPSSRQTLGDADALARSLLERIWEFLYMRGIEVVDSRPFCSFAEHGLAYSLMFRGTGCAPLLLPRSYAYDVAAWPILAHEIGHVVVANVPGLEDEVRTVLGEQLLVDQWASEVFADAIGTLLLGPAFVQAAARDLANPDSPDHVTFAAQDEYGQATEHPPPHLRIRFVTALLAEMGMRDKARAIWDEWNGAHGEPDAVFLPRGDGGYGGYELQPFLDGFSGAALTLTQTALRSLSEYYLTSVPGLAYTPREEHAVQEQAEAFRAGLPRRADPRTVVSAAVVVGLEDESRQPEALATLVKQSILGVGTGEPRHRPGDQAAGAPGRARRAGAVDRRTELIEAMILAEAVVTPPLALRGRSSTSWPSYPRP